jgi:hypothetical protein
MRMRSVRLPQMVSRCVLTASLLVCGACTGSVETKLPSVGAPGQLTAVDGKPLPVVIASTTGDSTLVTGGSVVMGEAIASGPYTLSLRHRTGTTTVASDVSGTTNLIANGSTITATIDLGVVLGKHVYTFGF